MLLCKYMHLQIARRRRRRRRRDQSPDLEARWRSMEGGMRGWAATSQDYPTLMR